MDVGEFLSLIFAAHFAILNVRMGPFRCNYSNTTAHAQNSYKLYSCMGQNTVAGIDGSAGKKGDVSLMRCDDTAE